MKDETYAFISDVKEKKITGRSARHKRTHTGKGGRCRFPSDNLSKKELMKMSRECKSYRLNDPMSWMEFRSMPEDLQVTYIKLLREKFNVPDKYIGEMFGINKDYIYRTFKEMGLQRNIRTSHPKWDKEGFYAWWHGVDKLPTPVPEEPTKHAPVISDITQEEKKTIFFGGTENLPEEKIHWVEDVKNQHIKAEPYVEDDLPFEEPDPIQREQIIALLAEVDNLKHRVDELLNSNEELMAVHEKDKQEIAWLRKEHDELQWIVKMREAQLEVVHLIFGGKNHER